MQSIKIDGGVPLNGSVNPSGSAISASKLILASLYTTEDVVLQNVPRVDFIEKDISIIRGLGGECTWLDKNKLKINTSGVNTHRIPFEIGSENRISLLAAGPLLFRFGKAVIPKPVNTLHKPNPIDRFISVWKDLGFKVVEDAEWINLETSEAVAKSISFKNSTHMGTENAILSALFLKGVTVINNAAEEPEIDDLIDFLNIIGGDVRRTESRRIEINGGSIYKGGNFEVQNDKNEVVFFAVGALITGGTVTIKNVDKPAVSAFLSVLNNMRANFEFQGQDLTVWHSGEKYAPVNVTSSPAPGFITDWMPALCLLATHAEGISTLTEGVYKGGWDYIRDLNRMGAKITPQFSASPVPNSSNSDDNPNLAPEAVSVQGPSTLRGVTLDIEDVRSGTALLLAALSAEGSTDLRGLEYFQVLYEDILSKLQGLGAKILIVGKTSSDKF
jgi:UDP-N-acetylglucosamine 1-carboxyvinyltransferase